MPWGPETIDPAEIAARLRRDLGNPTTGDFSDEQATDAIKAAAREYSKFRPREIVDNTTLDTVVGTQSYTISGVLDPEPYLVKHVAWGTSVWGDPNYTLSVSLGALERDDIYHNPGLLTIRRHKDAMINQKFGQDWKIVRDGATMAVWLIPCPEEVTDIWFWYGARHNDNASTIAAWEEELILLFARAKGIEAIAGSSVTRSMGPVSFDRGGAYDMAAKLKVEFYESLKYGVVERT